MCKYRRNRLRMGRNVVKRTSEICAHTCSTNRVACMVPLYSCLSDFSWVEFMESNGVLHSKPQVYHQMEWKKKRIKTTIPSSNKWSVESLALQLTNNSHSKQKLSALRISDNVSLWKKYAKNLGKLRGKTQHTLCKFQQIWMTEISKIDDFSP